MLEDPEIFERWLERYLRPRHPELELPIVAAFGAFISARKRGKLRPAQLSAIVDAASSPRTPLYVNATRYLAKLSADHSAACEAIARLSKSRKAHERFNAILSLGSSTPPPLVDSILRAGLIDRSARVRIKAADWILVLRNRRLISDLNKALASEANGKARRTMQFTIREFSGERTNPALQRTGRAKRSL